MNVEHVRLVVKSSITVVSFFVTYIYICAILDISCSFFFPFFSLSYDFCWFFFCWVYHQCAVRSPVCGVLFKYTTHTHIYVYINNSLTNRRERRRKKTTSIPKGVYNMYSLGWTTDVEGGHLIFLFFFYKFLAINDPPPAVDVWLQVKHTQRI
jgi:hypothetical protein